MRKKTSRPKSKLKKDGRTPHDSLFRSVFSDPQNIMGELKALLPKKVVEAIDWTTLHLASGTQFELLQMKQRIQIASPQNIQDWSIRALHATTLAEIFADKLGEST